MPGRLDNCGLDGSRVYKGSFICSPDFPVLLLASMDARQWRRPTKAVRDTDRSLSNDAMIYPVSVERNLFTM